jgi:hypothetical protein
MKHHCILTLTTAAVLAAGTPITSFAQEPAPTLAFTPNMQAANGPIPGDLSLYEKELAESDYFEPLTVNSLTPPGFGGRIYFPTIEDFITLQVLPAGAGGK